MNNKIGNKINTNNNSITKLRLGILAISVIAVLMISTLTVIQYAYATDAPIIISLVANDPDDLDDVFSNGDTITITFDSNTNTPGGTGMQAKTAVNQLFTFTESISRAYNGQWTAPDTFTITIRNAINAGPPIIGTTTVTPAGITPTLSADETSSSSFTTSPTLTGDFGVGLVIVPIGTVLDWWCSTDCTIPDRYALADGSIVNDSESPFNGETLPDFRDKFVRGVSVVGNVGEMGGTTSHTHTSNISTEIISAGSHTHTVNPSNTGTSTAGSHTHTVNPSNTGTTSDTHNHRWSSFDTGEDWRSYDSNGNRIEVMDWTGGIHGDGSGIYPFAVNWESSSTRYYYTNNNEHSHSVDIASTTSSSAGNHSHDASSSAFIEDTSHEPTYVGLIKIIRIK